VIAVAPVLDDGSPFPTTFWLTCPRLIAAVGELESAGQGARFAEAAASDPALSAEMAIADLEYRAARRAEGGGADPCASVGVAGQRDALAVKCLHARLAAFLSGVPDPVGRSVARTLSEVMSAPCSDPRCGADVVAGC
jgi:hypothetical protein